MLKTFNHWVNANYNHNDVFFPVQEDSYTILKQKETVIIVENLKKLDPHLLLACWWDGKVAEMLNGAVTGETVWQFFKTLNIVLGYQSVTTFLGISWSEKETYTKETCTEMFLTILFLMEKMEKAECQPTNKWINKVYLHNDIF